ncbi:Josephin-domain-containing protein [Glomus cerebriforme]|uniref:Ataxin-3 homolog n=1 Tax=Glomus cerebriforme TaxID=658196 RepID=A0A397TI72_9GLOM|nr:Josephin-domain-containing protein [Glomus cerebriforme]
MNLENIRQFILIMSDLVPYIIWEKQEGCLCAQHCLNSLLQGEYFTAVDLSEIARNLDQAEQAALSEGATEQLQTEDNRNANASTTSQNMDDSGFFSVQVLSHALKVWNIDIIPIGSEDGRIAKIHPEDEIAYICNLHEHWFTLRKFGGLSSRWYNLDSLLRGPESISQTYLGMLLNQLENEGYSIFVVKGQLPSSQADEYGKSLPDPNLQRQNVDEIDQAMIDAAIAASLENNDVSNNKEDVTKPIDEQNNGSEPLSSTIAEQPTIDELRAKRLAKFDRVDGK